MNRAARLRTALVAALLVAPACTSKTSTDGPAGGPVPGAADSHCGTKVVTVDPAQCNAPVAADAGVEDFGAPLFGSEGDDDDCKYHVKWTGAPRLNADTTFTVAVTHKADGKPLTGEADNVYIEAYLTDTHPAANAGAAAKEGPPGTYTIDQVRFDASGQWTVRFHVAAECHDTEQSPHGHAAFYVSVP